MIGRASLTMAYEVSQCVHIQRMDARNLCLPRLQTQASSCSSLVTPTRHTAGQISKLLLHTGGLLSCSTWLLTKNIFVLYRRGRRQPKQSFPCSSLSKTLRQPALQMAPLTAFCAQMPCPTCNTRRPPCRTSILGSAQAHCCASAPHWCVLLQ